MEYEVHHKLFCLSSWTYFEVQSLDFHSESSHQTGLVAFELLPRGPWRVSHVWRQTHLDRIQS